MEVNEKIIEDLDNYDWQQAFKYAPAGVSLEDVVEVISKDDGTNDGPDWIGLFRLRSGQLLFLKAWCDYTGWGCQEGGSGEVFETRKAAIQYMGDDDRYRLRLKMEY